MGGHEERRIDVMRYLILIEPTETGFSAYSPDLPGCASTGSTPAEVESNMRETVEGHLEELRLAGLPIPTPTTAAGYVEVAA
jgi:predicted RNase H-like HicB family nuclease